MPTPSSCYEDYPKNKIGLGICFFTYELENKKVLTDITMMILQTTSGNPAIIEFGAYHDPIGTTFNDPTGAAAVGVVGQ